MARSKELGDPHTRMATTATVHHVQYETNISNLFTFKMPLTCFSAKNIN